MYVIIPDNCHLRPVISSHIDLDIKKATQHQAGFYCTTAPQNTIPQGLLVWALCNNNNYIVSFSYLSSFKDLAHRPHHLIMLPNDALSSSHKWQSRVYPSAEEKQPWKMINGHVYQKTNSLRCMSVPSLWSPYKPSWLCIDLNQGYLSQRASKLSISCLCKWMRRGSAVLLRYSGSVC